MRLKAIAAIAAGTAMSFVGEIFLPAFQEYNRQKKSSINNKDEEE